MVQIQFKPDGWDETIKVLDDTEFIAGPVRAAFSEAADVVQLAIQQRAPRRIRGSVEKDIDTQHRLPEWVRVIVRSPMAHWFEFGTGLWGKRHKRIEPTARGIRRRQAVRQAEIALGQRRGITGHKPSLRLTIGGQVLFRPSTAGMRPRPFFFPAWEAVQGLVNQIFDKLLEEIQAKWRTR